MVSRVLGEVPEQQLPGLPHDQDAAELVRVAADRPLPEPRAKGADPRGDHLRRGEEPQEPGPPSSPAPGTSGARGPRRAAPRCRKSSANARAKAGVPSRRRPAPPRPPVSRLVRGAPAPPAHGRTFTRSAAGTRAPPAAAAYSERNGRGLPSRSSTVSAATSSGMRSMPPSLPRATGGAAARGVAARTAAVNPRRPRATIQVHVQSDPPRHARPPRRRRHRADRRRRAADPRLDDVRRRQRRGARLRAERPAHAAPPRGGARRARRRARGHVYASGQAAATAALLHLRPRRVAIAAGRLPRHARGDRRARAVRRGEGPARGRSRRGRRPLARDAEEPHLRAAGHRRPRRARPRGRRAARRGRHVRHAGAPAAARARRRPRLSLDDEVPLRPLRRARRRARRAGPGRSRTALRATRTVTGAVPGALETWLVLRGVRTLALRVRQQTATATRLAAWLEPRVARVWHPSLPSHPGHALAQRQMRGPGRSSRSSSRARRRRARCRGGSRLFRDATSLGGVESLVEWRRKHDPEAPPAPAPPVGRASRTRTISRRDLAQALGVR